MRKIAAALILLLGLAGFLFYGRHRTKSVVVQNVLLITIDTLRSDHLGCYGYGPAQTPNIDRWAKEGTLFENAITTTPLTLPAHSSIMTGQYPFLHGVRDNGGFYLDEKSMTLAETLKSAGFRTGGFVSAFVLDRRWGIAQGFDKYFDDFELSKYKMVSLDSVQRIGEETLNQAFAWMDQNRDSRFFAWIHFYDPHTPYEPPEPFRSAATVKGGVGLYDGEISYTDNLIGRIDQYLEQNHLKDTTLVVLTADHGESLGEHEESGHGFFVYDATVHVPLILRMPGGESRRIPEQVRVIDLFPTITDAAGVSVSHAIQGVSLLPFVRGGNLSAPLTAYSESYYSRFHYGWSELKALRTNEYKYIEAPQREFYRLQSAFKENQNLYTSDRKKAAPFEVELAKMISNSKPIQAPQAVDDDSLEKLQALGYIGSAVHFSSTKDGTALADPKEKIRLYNRVKLAQWFSAEGKREEAMNQLSAVLKEDSHILEAHLVLGNLYMKDKSYVNARESFQNALRVDPEYASAIFALARAYKEEGNFEAARTGFRRLIEKDARDSKPFVHLADMALEEKQFDQALSFLQKVIELDPNQAISRNRLGACYLEMKEYDKALVELNKSLELNTRLPNANFNSALAYEAKGMPDQAIGSYKKELEMYPEAYPAYFNLSRIYRLQGNLHEEQQQLETCIKEKPDFGIAYLYLAKNMMDTGQDIEKAKSLVLEGLPKVEDKAQLPLGHYLLADLYNRLGKPREAMTELAKAQALEKRL